jgi:hypothetical protein
MIDDLFYNQCADDGGATPATDAGNHDTTRMGRVAGLQSNVVQGDRNLITSGLVLFGCWTRDAPLPATDLARRRIDPAAWRGRLNYGRQTSAIASRTFYFERSGFLSHVCAEPKVVEVQPNTREAKNIVKLERRLTCTGKLTGSGEAAGELFARASISSLGTSAA